MKSLISAKQLTFRYFAIVAVAIIAVHYFVFELTTDDLEYAFAQNRLNKVHEFMLTEIQNDRISRFENLELLTQGKTAFDKAPSVLFNFEQLPTIFPDINALPYNTAIEVENEPSLQTYYVMKVSVKHDTKQQDALLVIDNGLYELSEEQLLSTHTKQITITIILTLLSLLVVVHISRKLTLPISMFSKTLSSQSPADLNLLSLPKEAHTKELKDMVSTFNDYQSQIQTLIERERAFNRYASHELRSPLMVMKGAITLLSESNDKAFTTRQLQRLNKSAHEMSEFVEILLSLTKPVNHEEQSHIIDKTLIEKVVENHTHLLENKLVTWKVNIAGSPHIKMQEAAFHILLGNLIKNAFAYTDKGEVIIDISTHRLCVIDTGKGYESKPEKIDGYGLGLLLVRDISRQYGYEFTLNSNNKKGTIATVQFH